MLHLVAPWQQRIECDDLIMMGQQDWPPRGKSDVPGLHRLQPASMTRLPHVPCFA